jgi:hypothetical protein
VLDLSPPGAESQGPWKNLQAAREVDLHLQD